MSKRQSRKSSQPRRARFHIEPKSATWALRSTDRARVSQVYKTQREAVAAARKLINEADGGEIVVHGRDGRIRGVDTYSLGGDSFDKISAVEGIFISDEMKRDFEALDRKRLTPAKRREWLIEKYGTRSDELRRRK